MFVITNYKDCFRSRLSVRALRSLPPIPLLFYIRGTNPSCSAIDEAFSPLPLLGSISLQSIHMPQTKTIAIVNASGRQAASLIRVASAVGYRVRAQIHTLEGVIPQELASLPNVTLFKGPLLNNAPLITTLFDGANLAFINTTSQAGDEVAIGRDLADAAKRAGSITHYIYSSMPDHAAHNPSRWISLPLWSCKFAVENYVRQLGLPATFVYAGIYNNNFTSLPYPLFQMELLENGSFEWRAPFHPDIPLPWLDAEHDVGPTVLQIFKDGPKRWNGHRYVSPSN
ncbi:nitrogen metabolic regulation protein [Histoplasma capsulatum var. duboisii H88]|uniref:Nitrogen metabolic regulation protein n=1 Tax=Ajellomyces capsulatus (strain H88) TaxID=544711 RepID=F0UPF4_AJEC8|nr:nitrogen metabolic regulation protein [Histoplasma capsulatum var. duboisii H88]